jgi:hypothetical protein
MKSIDRSILLSTLPGKQHAQPMAPAAEILICVLLQYVVELESSAHQGAGAHLEACQTCDTVDWRMIVTAVVEPVGSVLVVILRVSACTCA